jgi:hypothetical protein
MTPTHARKAAMGARLVQLERRAELRRPSKGRGRLDLSGLADDELEFLEETLTGMGAAEWAGMGEDELQQRFVGWQEARGAPS